MSVERNRGCKENNPDWPDEESGRCFRKGWTGADCRASHLKMRGGGGGGRESPRQAAEQSQGPRAGMRLACLRAPGTQ